MTHFDVLRGKALENYGVVTAAAAAELGLQTSEMVRYCSNGRLVHVGFGTYRLGNYTPTRLTRFAEAISIVGEGSYLYGQSALVLGELLPFDAQNIYVATAERVRRSLPAWIKMQKVTRKAARVEFGGIPSQALPDAVDACREQLSPDQLHEIAAACTKNNLLADDLRQAVLDRLGESSRDIA